MSQFQRKHLVRVYGGVVLDDGGDASGHHTHLTHGPLAGGILFLARSLIWRGSGMTAG